jgi:hypothetical protein
MPHADLEPRIGTIPAPPARVNVLREAVEITGELGHPGGIGLTVRVRSIISGASRLAVGSHLDAAFVRFLAQCLERRRDSTVCIEDRPAQLVRRVAIFCLTRL